ncbi:[NiFe]-hydrogenase assembly chaperone HybE [Magnetofaba australis]|uniref:Uncharacterized protein n=1 Tax=Magnetofaba australis IT-1 TaxID=1434232 RepID=A0A1Y2KBK0_9PROT|nr:[NiFe]-hydrogenase assembly chaperone HybE [Magnetofaba australis]OSM07298.1 hypothetical protein MAIT1_04481 [Magnetofaba australis IT-1]
MDETTLKDKLESVFGAIERDQMRGLPLLNPIIKVEAVGVQPIGDLWCGVVITPWLMSLLVVDPTGLSWQNAPLGEKIHIDFPERSHAMAINEFDGVGRCLTLSLESPMHPFPTHDSAVSRAESFLDVLMTDSADREPTLDDTPLDEARMQRFLSGEDMRDIFEQERQALMAENGFVSKEGSSACPASGGAAQKMAQPVSRRDLFTGLRGGEPA